MSAASKAPAKVGARRARSHSHPVAPNATPRDVVRVLHSRGREHSRRILAMLRRAGYEASAYNVEASFYCPALLLRADYEGPGPYYYVPKWVNVVLSYFPVSTRTLSREGWARLRANRKHIVMVQKASRTECEALLTALITPGPWVHAP